MRQGPTASETWKRMVLRSMPPPLWLAPDAPAVDIVLSSRCRLARNLVGEPFPERAQESELMRIADRIVPVAEDFGLKRHGRLTEAERDFLLGCRLISPEFDTARPGSELLLDQDRAVSLMVNEEDHVRLQSLTPGWSLGSAQQEAMAIAEGLEGKLDFARNEEGFVTAHPANSGHGRRRSALMHLIGLAHGKRLRPVMEALADSGVVARGLYGESSRAVGAFFQVSTTDGSLPSLEGAGEYVIRQEREARSSVSPGEVEGRCRDARDFVVSAIEVEIEDALKSLAWVRWGACLGVVRAGVREVDEWISTMEIYGTRERKTAARHRAEFLRERFEKRALLL